MVSESIARCAWLSPESWVPVADNHSLRRASVMSLADLDAMEEDDY